MKILTTHLLGASLLTLIATTSPVAAQTCVSAPTCAELGYTLTSTATCAGTALKCPFDKTKYFCPETTNTFKAMMPDYKKRTIIPVRTNYTIKENGWILLGAASQVDDGKSSWSINGTSLGSNSPNDDENEILFPVAKGDVVYHNGGSRWNFTDFYPCRGN